MPPEVIDAMARYRNVLGNLDRSQATRLLQSWVQAMGGVNSEMDLLANEMAQRVAEGKPTKLWHLHRMERYQSLMRQMGQQVNRYTDVATGDVSQAQQLMARLGLEHSQGLIDMQTESLLAQFDRLGVGAFEHMIGNAGDGSPLASLFADMPKQTGQAVTDALLKGSGLGWHPTKTAQAMKNAAGLTYQRSVLIARTEQLRVYRETTRQQYIASELVEGYRRVSSKSVRTCIACLMTDGKFFPLTVPFEEHPNGRCTAIPMVKERGSISWESGEDWFRRQDVAIQQQIMGPKRFEAWQAGKFKLGDIVTKRVDSTWGNSYVPTPLSELVNQEG
jgi:hypothetical protein